MENKLKSLTSLAKGFIIFTVCYLLFITLLLTNSFVSSETISALEHYYVRDEIDDYILGINEELTLEESQMIKNCLKKYTNSDKQFYIMLSIVSIESKFKRNANSYLGASYGRGLAQVSEIALKEYNLWKGTVIKPTELYDIDINLKVACFTYQHLSRREDLTLVENVMAYNKGLRGYRRNKKDLRYYNKFFVEFSNFWG